MSTSWPRAVWADLGVELHAVDAALAGPRARRPAPAPVRAVTRKPGGAADDRVAVAHPHVLAWSAGRRTGADDDGDLEARCGRTRPTRCGRPRRRAAGRRAGRRSRCRGSGRRRRRPRGRCVGAPSTCTDFGPAAEDDPAGPPRQHLGDGHVARHDLAVDVRLAHPPGDQLRVLRAEIDDQNGVEVTQENSTQASGRECDGWPDRGPGRERRGRGNADGWPVGRGPGGRGPARGGIRPGRDPEGQDPSRRGQREKPRARQDP